MEYSSTKQLCLPDISALLVDSDSGEEHSQNSNHDDANGGEQMKSCEENNKVYIEAHVTRAETPAESITISSITKPAGPNIRERAPTNGQSPQKCNDETNGSVDFVTKIQCEMFEIAKASREQSLLVPTTEVKIFAPPYLHTANRGAERFRNSQLRCLRDSDLKILLDPMELPVYSEKDCNENAAAQPKALKKEHNSKDSAAKECPEANTELILPKTDEELSSSEMKTAKTNRVSKCQKPKNKTQLHARIAPKPKANKKRFIDASLQCSIEQASKLSERDASTMTENEENNTLDVNTSANNSSPVDLHIPLQESSYRVIKVSSSLAKQSKLKPATKNKSSNGTHAKMTVRRESKIPDPSSESKADALKMQMDNGVADAISGRTTAPVAVSQSPTVLNSNTRHANAGATSKQKNLKDTSPRADAALTPLNSPIHNERSKSASQYSIRQLLIPFQKDETPKPAATHPNSNTKHANHASPTKPLSTSGIDVLATSRKKVENTDDDFCNKDVGGNDGTVVEKDLGVRGTLHTTPKLHAGHNTNSSGAKGHENKVELNGESDNCSPDSGRVKIDCVNDTSAYEQRLSELHVQLRNIRALLEEKLGQKSPSDGVPRAIAFHADTATLSSAASVTNHATTPKKLPVRLKYRMKQNHNGDQTYMSFSPNSSFCDSDSFGEPIWQGNRKKTVQLLNPHKSKRASGLKRAST